MAHLHKGGLAIVVNSPWPENNGLFVEIKEHNPGATHDLEWYVVACHGFLIGVDIDTGHIMPTRGGWATSYYLRPIGPDEQVDTKQTNKSLET